MVIFGITCPILVEASPPPIIDYYANSYQIAAGSYYSGTLSDTRTNNEAFLTVKASWWWFIGFFFDADIYFDFTNRVYDAVIVDIADNAPGTNMMVHVYYTTGSPDHFPVGAGDWPNGWLSDGLYEFTLDSRVVDRVLINFFYGNFVGGDRYLKIDMIKLRIYNVL